MTLLTTWRPRLLRVGTTLWRSWTTPLRTPRRWLRSLLPLRLLRTHGLTRSSTRHPQGPLQPHHCHHHPLPDHLPQRHLHLHPRCPPIPWPPFLSVPVKTRHPPGLLLNWTGPTWTSSPRTWTTRLRGWREGRGSERRLLGEE